MASATEEILTWIRGRPYWERAALAKVMSGTPLEESDYQELLGYMLQDVGLAEKTGQRPSVSLPMPQGDDARPSKPPKITRLYDLSDVNALADGYEIQFGPQITAVYGGNGSGKSGYARVLACAAFARGKREILPDVSTPFDPESIASASIDIDDGESKRSLYWQDGTPCPELRHFHVYDATSVEAHLTQENELSFVPTGFSYLTRLGEVTDEVRNRLRNLIEERSRKPMDFALLFQDGKSEVRSAVADIGPHTDITRLKELAVLTAEEERSAEGLRAEVKRLGALDLPARVAKLEEEITDLQRLIGRVREVEAELSDDKMQEINSLVGDLSRCRGEAEKMGADQFRATGLKTVGSDTWQQFIKDAKALADAEVVDREPYPHEGDSCLLCRQMLSAEATDLIRRLWGFLVCDAPARAAAALAACTKRRQQLDTIDLGFFGADSLPRRLLQREQPQLASAIAAFVDACRERRDEAAHALASASKGSYTLLHVAAQRRREVRRADAQRVSDDLKKANRELRELTHRQALAEHIETITRYVSECTWAKQAEQRIGSTSPITRKYDELFDLRVTDRYTRLFEQHLKELGRPIKVGIGTRGQKAKTVRQIVLTLGDDPEWMKQFRVDQVLSEGEKRLVALCDFMTEVVLDEENAGIILDDPVTSLDNEWKEAVAGWLVTQASRRQVVVFTHDLAFLYHLTSRASENGIDMPCHWVKRGDEDEKPGYVYLDNSPGGCDQAHRTAARARDYHARSKNAPPAEQEGLLRLGFAALRSCYESFVIFDLFKGVVQRFSERISVGRLKDVAWDDTIAQAVIDKTERLSRHIEAHSHSAQYAPVPPTRQALLTEIEAFDELRGRHRALKKAASSGG